MAAVNSSPLQMTRRSVRARSAPRASRNAPSMDGTKWTVVTLRSLMTRVKYDGSRCPPGSAITRRAPANSGQKNSQTETSKLKGVFCTTASEGVSPYCSCIQSRRLVTPRCVFIAPLGRPVEPDV
jgi:hypothetical protein